MPDPLMYQEEMYVVLKPGEAEVFMTPAELLDYLSALLGDRQDDLPRDLQRFRSISDQAKHLRDTACQWALQPGEAVEWYIVRLEKP